MLDCRMATSNELAKAEAMSQDADYYSILGYKFRICSNETQFKDLFRYMYRQFLIQQPGVIDNKFSFFALNDRGSLLLIDNKVYPLREPAFLPSQVHARVLNIFMERITDYFLFHAAAAAKEDQGIIIIGPSGSGKTSFVLKLIQEGYEFLSDELSPVHNLNLKLHPFPRSLGLRQGTLELFPYLKKKQLRHNLKMTQWEKWFLDAASLSPRNKPCSVKAIYFLETEQQKNDYLVDVGLFREDSTFVSTLNALPGISLIKQLDLQRYPTYRFHIERTAQTINNFLHTCQKFKELIIYQEIVREEKKIFHKRKFVPIDKPTAVLELLKHMCNNSKNSHLRRRFPSLSQLLVQMGRIIEGVECWRVKQWD